MPTVYIATQTLRGTCVFAFTIVGKTLYIPTAIINTKIWPQKKTVSHRQNHGICKLRNYMVSTLRGFTVILSACVVLCNTNMEVFCAMLT